MEILNIFISAIVCVVIILCIKNYAPEYAVLASVAAACMIFVILIDYFKEIFSFINELVSLTNVSSEFIKILFKALGITYLSQITYDIALDCDEKTIATQIDIASKTVMLTISLPIFKEVINIIKTILG